MKFFSKTEKKTVFNVFYRQPKGQIERFEKFSKGSFPQIKNSNKHFHDAGNFNLNVLDHEICKKVQKFLNKIFENDMIPIIDKPTRVTNKIAKTIDHILNNSYTETIFKTTILKCDVSDHFPICLIIPSLKGLL